MHSRRLPLFSLNKNELNSIVFVQSTSQIQLNNTLNSVKISVGHVSILSTYLTNKKSYA